MSELEKHFVEFYSPGTFVSEQTRKPIEKWDVDEAVSMSKEIKERYNAIPYGFRFITRGRSGDELDSKEVDSSAMYYLGGKVETYEEISKKEGDSILANNMKYNDWEKVITNTNSWKITQPLHKDDVVLEV